MLCPSAASSHLRTVDSFRISIFDGVTYCGPAIKPHISNWGSDHAGMNANLGES